MTITTSVQISLFAKVSQLTQDNVWLLIRIASLCMVIVTIFVGLQLIAKVKNILEDWNVVYNSKTFAPILTIIFANLAIQIMGSTWDIFFWYDNWATCHEIFKVPILDMFLWLIFKLSVLNYWIWPYMASYNSWKMYWMITRSVAPIDSSSENLIVWDLSTYDRHQFSINSLKE